MARIRAVKPLFFRSASVAELPSDACRLTWIGLWTYCDDQGRGVDDARLIKGEIWALHDRVTVKVVESHLQALTSGPEPMICRYEVNGRRYLHAINWRDHQKINRPSPSRIPHCPTHDGITDDSLNPHGTNTEGSRQEGNREQGTGNREQGKDPSHVQQQQEPGSRPSGTIPKNRITTRPALDTPPPAPAAAASEAEKTIQAALEILYHRRPPAHTNPTRHHTTVIDGLQHEHADTIASLDWNTPWTPQTLADWLEPVHRPTDTTRRDYQLEPLGCDNCEAGWQDTGNGTVIPCPDCRKPA